MEHLVQTMKAPEALAVRLQFTTTVNLLFGPINVVMDQKFTAEDQGKYQEVWRREQKENRCRQHDVQACMKQSTRVPVTPFVRKHVTGLQTVIGDGMFDEEARHKSES